MTPLDVVFDGADARTRRALRLVERTTAHLPIVGLHRLPDARRARDAFLRWSRLVRAARVAALHRARVVFLCRRPRRPTDAILLF